MLRQLSKRLVQNSEIKRSFLRSVSSIGYPALNEFRTYTPEDGFVLNSIFEPITLSDLPVDQYVWKNVNRWQNKVAIVCGVTDRKYTYAELRDHCAAIAVRLRTKLQLNAGDVIAICLPNIPEFAIALLGGIEAGLVVTTINPIYTAEEISRQLSSSQPKIIFTLSDSFQKIEAAKLLSKESPQIVTIKTSNNQSGDRGSIDFAELANLDGVNFNLLEKKNIDITDTCALLYSSGTTGLPKGVMLTHLNLTSNCEMLNAKVPNRRLIMPTTNEFQDVLPSVLPFYHIYGFCVSLIAKLSLGCKIVSLPKFDPMSFVKALVEHKATVVNLVPPIVLFLANSDKVTRSNLENLRLVVSAGAPLGASDAEKFKIIAPQVEFMQGYGLTETSSVCLQSPNNCSNYATIGFTSSNTQAKIVKLDDPNFIGCDVDELGELLIRGSQVMKGYLNNKEATDEAIVSGNWFRTGDMVSYDSNGLCYVKDRLKELIKVKGYQVAPAELEEILRTHPKIEEAAVIGVPHDSYGEVPKAFIVGKKGVKVSESEIHSFVEERIAEYKRFRGGIQFIESVPKSQTGKIMRRELKTLYG